MTTTLASHAHAHAHAHSAKISTFLAQTKPTADATSATVLFLGERGAGATPVSYTHLTLPTKRIV